jgi:ferredoxin-thioredoxin reductase catalytic subunit
MKKNNEISKDRINKLYSKLKFEAESSGYHLNFDEEFTKDLIKGLIINEERYGYQACPCRLASGNKSEDLDIICPCDYRDPDLDEYNACYCALYVTNNIIDGKKQLTSIPDRRLEDKKISVKRTEFNEKTLVLSKPIWRCKVCGYLCARDNPPEICPICKAKKERFEKFLN